MSNRSMIDVAYALMSKKKKSVSFSKLWDEVSQIMGYTESVAERKIASFYTALMLDNRFASLGKNVWDLRTRHTYNETHFDTSTLVIDDESDDSDEAEELAEGDEEFEKPVADENQEESF